jgi:hypothetical protein
MGTTDVRELYGRDGRYLHTGTDVVLDCELKLDCSLLCVCSAGDSALRCHCQVPEVGHGVQVGEVGGVAGERREFDGVDDAGATVSRGRVEDFPDEIDDGVVGHVHTVCRVCECD